MAEAFIGLVVALGLGAYGDYFRPRTKVTFLCAISMEIVNSAILVCLGCFYMKYIIVTFLAALFLLQSTIWIHAEGLSLIRLEIGHYPVGERLRLAIVVSAAILLHMLEIGLYAAVTWLLNVVVDVGDIVGAREFSAMDYFYYSAETFTALGSGDLSATGGLRLIASLEPLNGLVLIAWTGAFTYWTMEHYWHGKQASDAVKKLPAKFP